MVTKAASEHCSELDASSGRVRVHVSGGGPDPQRKLHSGGSHTLPSILCAAAGRDQPSEPRHPCRRC